MNDLDDYEFGSVENSNLSSIFGRDRLSEATSNSLIYKAPKQPIAVKEAKAQSANFYYKYINLYEILENTEQRHGKHIICLLKSETNPPEILIYQNKKNILVRTFIKTISISIHTEKKYCLSILANRKSFLLEYNGEEDFDGFITEFTNIGGIIQKNSSIKNRIKSQNEEVSEEDLPLLHPKTVLSTLTNPESIVSPLDPIDQIRDEDVVASSSNTQDKNEKDVILARLAKMGLPQLPSFQKDFTDSSQAKLIETDQNVAPTSTIKNRKEFEGRYEAENNTHLEAIENDCALIKRTIDNTCSTQDVHMMNRSIDSISFMLAENRLNNAELRHQISLLTSNMVKKIPEHQENKADDQLKSKLRAYKMKTENLESELYQIKKKYAELQKKNEELSEKANNFSGGVIKSMNQENEIENDILKLNMKEIICFIQNLPFKTTEIDWTPLMLMKEKIKDQELKLVLENSLSFIQNKIDSSKVEDGTNHSKKRAEFFKEIKRIMNSLFSKTSNLLDDEKRNVLAEDIRSATLELMRNYDENIHDTIG